MALTEHLDLMRMMRAGSIEQAQLAQRVGVQQAAVARWIRELREVGWVVQTKGNPPVCSLTTRGRAVLALQSKPIEVE